MKSKIINIEWLDTLRALAIIGVIIIHISSPLLKMIYGKNMEFWWIGNILDSAVRFSVPLFLMLSGATLLGNKYNLTEFYKKRILRVVLPFLFWIIVYLIYRWLMLGSNDQPKSIHKIFQWTFDLFLKEGVSKHFWYIYMILFLYLFFPFLGKGLQKLDKSLILYLLLGWVLITYLCKNIPLNLYNWSGEYESKFLGYFQFSGYLVLGYYLSAFSITSTKIRFFASSVFFLTIIISAVSTYILSKNAQKLDLSMYGNLTINTIAQSTAIFLCVKDSCIKYKYISNLKRTISNYSYGIYLVHILIIGVFFNNGIFWTMSHPLISLPLLTVMTLVSSFAIIYIMRKIPFGKYISG